MPRCVENTYTLRTYLVWLDCLHNIFLRLVIMKDIHRFTLFPRVSHPTLHVGKGSAESLFLCVKFGGAMAAGVFVRFFDHAGDFTAKVRRQNRNIHNSFLYIL